MDPEITHGTFLWEIENFLLCLPHKNFTAESSRFILPTSEWFLKLTVQHRKKDMTFIVQLCRNEDGVPYEIAAKYCLSLRSAENTIAVIENEHPFKKGDNVEILRFRTTWQDFWALYANESDDDLLLVECDIISAKDSSGNCHSDPSEDFITLLKRSDKIVLASEDTKILPYNAYLVTEDGDVLVHKEILCAQSPVFEEEFQVTGDSRLEVNFSRDAIVAMLRYMYSGSVGEIFIHGNLPLDLYECAVEYEVFDLMKYLAPWVINTVNVIKCRKIKLCFDYPDYTKLLTHEKQHFRHKLSDDTEAIVYSNFDKNRETVTFRIKLTTNRSTEAFSALGLFHILDFEGNKLIRKQHIFYLNHKKDYDSELEVEVLHLITANKLTGRNAVTLQCEYKLGFPPGSKLSESSDIEYFSYQEIPHDFSETGNADINNSWRCDNPYLDNFALQCGDVGQVHPDFAWTYVNFSQHNLPYVAY